MVGVVLRAELWPIVEARPLEDDPLFTLVRIGVAQVHEPAVPTLGVGDGLRAAQEALAKFLKGRNRCWLFTGRFPDDISRLPGQAILKIRH
jgi:hypothetical protein